MLGSTVIRRLVDSLSSPRPNSEHGKRFEESCGRSAGCRLERLEERRLLSAVYPTANEQYMLELINRARANPAAEAARFGISLNEGLAAGTISTAAKQPLAFNPYLTDAATKHSQWMLNTGTFSHFEGSVNPQARMQAAGYVFNGIWAWGENIDWRGSYPNTPPLTSTTALEHQDLFVDSGEAGRGHRINLLNDTYREVGVGIVTGTMNTGGHAYNAVMTTEDFAASGNSAFLTGVIYRDADHNNFYTPGEGLGGVTITAQRITDGAVFSTSTWGAGGYTLALAPGSYRVSASGSTFGATATSVVTMGTRNVEQDFLPGATAAPSTSSPAQPAAAPATITGVVYRDVNNNGTFDSSDTRLSGVRVFIDANRDGKWDNNEVSATTNQWGDYTFNVPAGTYRIAEVIPTGLSARTPSEFTITVKSGQVAWYQNFGND